MWQKKKKKGGDESFQGMDLEKIQELIDITSEELTDLMVMSSSKPVLDDEWEDVEETVPEIKLTLNNLAESLQLLQTSFNCFYNLDPSLIQALDLKQMVEERLVPYRTIFRKTKKQKCHTNYNIFL